VKGPAGQTDRLRYKGQGEGQDGKGKSEAAQPVVAAWASGRGPARQRRRRLSDANTVIVEERNKIGRTTGQQHLGLAMSATALTVHTLLIRHMVRSTACTRYS
jgi:hypothetical protein